MSEKETSQLLLRVPRKMREKFKKITKELGSNETSTVNLLIAEFIRKYEGLLEERESSPPDAFQLVQQAKEKRFEEEKRIEGKKKLKPPSKKAGANSAEVQKED